MFFGIERSTNPIFYLRHSTSEIEELPICILRPRRLQNPPMLGLRIRRPVESHLSTPKLGHTTCGSRRRAARREGGARWGRAARDADLNYQKMPFWAYLWKHEQTNFDLTDGQAKPAIHPRFIRGTTVALRFWLLGQCSGDLSL